MSVASWSEDSRMGVSFIESMEIFKSLGVVTFQQNEYHATKKAHQMVESRFGSKTIEEAIQKCYEVKDLYIKPNLDDYPITRIPLDYFISSKPVMQKALYKFHNMTTKWFNNWNQLVISKIMKMRYRHEYNMQQIYLEFYPNEIPTKLKVYRGLKSTYKPKQVLEYTSWTFDYNQAKRFATYHFVDRFRPTYAKTQIVLEGDINVSDIAFFIGKHESEIILKSSDVQIQHIHDLKKDEI
jgi:hypothetical protein